MSWQINENLVKSDPVELMFINLSNNIYTFKRCKDSFY